MNRILYRRRCRCKEQFLRREKKKEKKKRQVSPRLRNYSFEIDTLISSNNHYSSKTFYVKYKKTLSLTAKFILSSFKNKYIDYAIDDLIYILKSDPTEQNSLLSILYSTVISLQNNFFANFFDIWIIEISIEKIVRPNKFLTNNSKLVEQFNLITIKLAYNPGVLSGKSEVLW